MFLVKRWNKLVNDIQNGHKKEREKDVKWKWKDYYNHWWIYFKYSSMVIIPYKNLFMQISRKAMNPKKAIYSYN